MSQRRIDSYFLHSSSSRSSSTASTVIEVDSDAPTDDEAPAGTQRSRTISSLSQQSIESYFVSPATRSSSAPIIVTCDDSGWTSEDDHLPLSVLMARCTQLSAVARRADIRRAVVHRALSDVSNVRRLHWRRVQYAQKKSFYHQVRQRFALPENRAMCTYCGVREHTALHHEDGFERAGTGVSSLALQGHYYTSAASVVIMTLVPCSVLSPCADPSTWSPDSKSALR
jgi:hypothetical protein